MRRILLILLVSITAVIAAFAIFIQLTWKNNLSESYPVEEINIEADSAMIAHGKYLVYGPAHCSGCHVPINQIERVDNGEELPLIGGFEFSFPFGQLYSSNITMDKETGIGDYTDGELYRMMRHNIKRDGSVTPELMPFANMSKYDVESIIAYLRTTEPVYNDVPENNLNLVGKAVFKYLIEPSVPVEDIPNKVQKAVTLEYGKYLAASVANCRGCHTARDLSTGAFTGPEYAGGFIFGPNEETQGWTFVTPNLTNSAELPVMETEASFIARFKAGRLLQTSPMPWGSFKKLDDTDLKAVYKYLKSLDPVSNPEAGVYTPPQEEQAKL